MRTVGVMPTVTTELFHVPFDKVYFVVANSGNELSFVSGSSGSVTSQTETGLSSQLVGAQSQNHAERLGHVYSLGLFSSPSALRINALGHNVEQTQIFRLKCRLLRPEPCFPNSKWL